MIVRSFFYGLLAHLILGWAFFVFLPYKAPRPAQPRIPVQIHIEEKPGAQVSRRSASSGAAASGRAQPRSSGTSSPSSSPTATPPRYADFLPQAVTGELPLPQEREPDEGALIPGHQFKQGSSGTTKQNLLIDASILSGALDVPLKARRISSGSEAFLRIVRVGDQRLRIVDLRGDPMLRAVIFENLHEPKIVDLILQLMDELQENSLPITLQTLTIPADRVQEEDDFTWIGRKLVIRKSAPPEWKAPAGALALPDEDAKKAKIKDRLEMERFQRSRAYRSAIQNYDLPIP